MERIVRWMNKPGSVLAAGAVGMLAVGAVMGNLLLASCESGGGMGLGSRAGAGKGVATRARAREAASPGVLAASGGGTNGSTSAPGAGATTQSSGASAVPAAAASAGVGAMPVGEPSIRVRVASAVTSVSVSSSMGLSFASGQAGNVPMLGAASANEPRATGVVTVSASGGGGGVGGRWVINAPGMQGQGGAVFSSGQALVISPTGGMLMINGQAHPGRLRLTLRNDASGAFGSFDVVEYVGLEDYLPGVVGKEMLSGWPAEAYRVQAVCARTYALHERSRSMAAGESFDVESSDRDQVYGGVSENRAAIDGVRSTRGQILTFEGKVLRAYFSSTCGGRTASARDTWPIGPGFEYNLALPLQARQRAFACQQSPLYRWQVVRDVRELGDRFRAYGERSQMMIRQIGEIRAIEALGYNEDGRPSLFKVIEPGGKWYQLTGEQIRLACNTSGLATVVQPGVGVGAGAGLGAPGSGSGMSTANLPEVTRKSRVNSSDFEASVRGRSVTISGRGFGHGVGMCQFCAKGFAERGDEYRAMLLRFYPGASVEKAY